MKFFCFFGIIFAIFVVCLTRKTEMMAMNKRINQIVKMLAFAVLMSCTSLYAQNLISNGSFLYAAGEGYSSDYEFSWGLGGNNDVGKYCQCTNARLVSNSMFSFTDHTSGSGDYMVVNGATNSSMRVWYTTVNVEPHSYYDFSLWITNLSAGGGQLESMRTKLKIKFNNVTVIDNYMMPNVSVQQGIWNQMPTYRWYSGNASTALIEIYDNCTSSNGNDFGLDDITMTYAYSNVVEAHDDEVTTCFETPVDINPMQNDVVSPNSILPNVNFSIIGQPQHGSLSWLSGTTYRYTPNTGYSGEDGFTYKLTFGTNDITSYGYVGITVNARPQRTITQHACESYTWNYNGQTYTQSGQYSYVLTSPNACDSLLVLNLTIHHAEEETLPAVEACNSYTWHGTTYTTSGVYDYITTTQWGCVLTQHLPLTIYYSDELTFEVSSCESYVWHGQTYTQSGTYSYQTTNEHGCDRTEWLNLTITDRYREVISLTECDSYYWPRTQQWYYETTMDSVVVDGPQGACDSTFVLNLTMHYADVVDLDPVEACDSYTWHGQTYTESGLLTYETTNEYGCDRTEQLQLTIHESETVELQSITACDEYVWHGHTYNETGVVVFDTVNQYGCNLQYILPMTINHSDTVNWEPVTECDSYLWYGQNITETGQYTHMSTTPEGCDRLERIFVTINYSGIDTLAPITACDAYEWHGQDITQTGYYSYETLGPTGCPYTEVRLVTINHSSEYEFNVTSCESYEWFGETYTEPGTYTYMLSNSQGCDSLLIMHLEIGETFTYEEQATGCESYEWHGEVYTEDGDYEFEVHNPEGCDSLFILHLTIAPTFAEEEEAEACYSYTWIDQTYTESGDYERHFTSAMGCDSLVTLHLTIKQAVYHEFEQQTCLPFTWNGITYYTDGDYEQTFVAHNGCDSIATMHLVFSDAMTSEFERQTCAPIYWEGQYCDHNGDYVHTYASEQGCDSIVTMHFSLTEQIVHEFDTLACEPFEWYGYQCEHDNMLCTHVFQTAQGCDSLVKMRVFLNETVNSTQFVSACDYYEYDGVLYDEPGITFIYLDTLYTTNGCDSLISRIRLEITDSESLGAIQGSPMVYVSTNIVEGVFPYYIEAEHLTGNVTWSLTNPDWIIKEAGDTYCLVEATTPGTATLKANFTVEECGEMERTFDIVAGFFGIDENGLLDVKLYPNPTKGQVTVEAESVQRVRIVNMMGQVMEAVEVGNQQQVVLDMGGFTPSVYLLEIETQFGIAKRRVVVCR